MTAFAACARATANTGATTQNVTVTSFGTVAAVFCVVTNATTDGSETAEAQMSLGFWVPSSTHRAIGFVSEDNKGTRTDTKVIRTKDHAIVLINNAGQVIRKATFAATTNGITISWFDSAGTATAPPAAWKMEFLFIGGTDAEAAIVDVAGPPVTGNGETVISSLLFQPDALIFLGPGTFATSPSTEEGAAALLGFSTNRPTIKNSLISWADPDNVTTTAVVSLVSNAMCLATGSGGSDSCSVSAYGPTGFTVQNDALVVPGPDSTVLALELPGLNWWTGTISSPTSTGNADHTNPGFKPQAAIFALGLCATVGTIETDQDAGPFGVGIAGLNHGSMVSGSACVRSFDGQNLALGNSDTGSSPSAGPVRILDGQGTLRLAADTPVWIQAGVRLNWGTVQGSARHLPALFIGAVNDEIAPSAVAAPGVVSTPTIAADLRPSAAAAPGVVSTPTIQLQLTPSPAAAPGVVSTPTVASVLTPAAVVAPGVVPAPSVEQFHAPDPVVGAGVVPAPTITLEAVPAPVEAPGVVSAPTVAAELAPSAVVAVGVIPDPTVAFAGSDLTPSPVVAAGVVPEPTLTLEAVPGAVVAPGVVQAPTIAAEASPAAVVAPGVVEAPTVSQELTPGPVVAPGVAPAPTLALVLGPSPVVAPGVVPDPVVEVGALELAPAAVVAPGVVPTPTIALEVRPDPVVAPGVVPPIALGGISAPDPVVSAGVVPAPTVALELHPDPVVAPGVVPAIALGPVAAPDPVSAAGVLPAPLVVLELAPAPVVAAGVVAVPLVRSGRARFLIGLELNRRAQTSRADVQRRLDLPLEDEPGTIALDLEVPTRL